MMTRFASLAAVAAFLCATTSRAADAPVCGDNIVNAPDEQCDGTAAAPPPSLGYRVVDYITIYEPTPPGPVLGYSGGFPIYEPEWHQIFERFDMRHLVDDLGVKEVWVWSGGMAFSTPSHDPAIHTPEKFRVMPESNMSSPVTGDISNSFRDPNDLPVYSHDYVVYGQNFRRSQAEAVHNHGHQLEAMLTYANQKQDGNSDLFWQKFVGNNGSLWATGRCGDTHHPPNASFGYDYLNTTLVESDIEDWKPDGTGVRTFVNADTWGSLFYAWPGGPPASQQVESQWYLYWMQSMPGRDNGVHNGADVMTNWWDFTGDWDGSSLRGQGLHQPYTPPVPSSLVYGDGSDVMRVQPAAASGGIRSNRNIQMRPAHHSALTGDLAAVDDVTLRPGNGASAAMTVPDAHTLLLLHFDDDLLGVSSEAPMTATGLTFEPGVFGDAVRVDGTDVLSYATAGNFLPQSGTVEFWVQPLWNGNDGTTRGFFSVGSELTLAKDGASNLVFIIRLPDSEAYKAYSLNDWIAGSWHHIAATWQIPGSMHVYVDGIERISNAAEARDLINPLPATLGVGNGGVAPPANAVIDELEISDVPRSADEIGQSFVSGLTITSLEPVPTTPTMYPTWQQKARVDAGTPDGPVVVPPAVVQWAASDPGVASVDNMGTVTALAPGEFDLIATVGVASGSTHITVLAPVLPVVHEPIGPFLATPAAGAIHDMPVAILRFLPTTDGVNLDVSWDPDYWSLNPITLDELESRIETFDRHVKFGLEEGSRFRGYKYSACPGTCTATCTCAVCGNQAIEAPFEQCDDGNLVSGDGCDADCRFETVTTTTLPSVAHCGATPAVGCLGGLKASLRLREDARDTKDQIAWKWGGGPTVVQGNLGDPKSTTAYTLCLYDSASGVDMLVGGLQVDPSAAWTDKDPKGWSYKDTMGSEDGVIKAQLRTGPDGKSKVQVIAKGAKIPMPTPFNASNFFAQDAHVTVQLINDATSTCWSSEFASAAVNTAAGFTAKTP